MTSTILAVDDSPESLRVFVGVLTAEGYQVREAGSGEAAMASAVADPPDLILLDVRMTGISGFEVCRRLKAVEETRHIPVILVSASADVEERVEGLQSGAADYIVKPFLTSELLARVRTQLALALVGAELLHMKDDLRRSLDQAERGRRALLSLLEDQKVAATTLGERTGYLQLALHAAGMGVWRWDLRSDVVETVYGVGPISGLPADSHSRTGEAFKSLVHPADLPAVTERLRLACELQEPYQTEFRIVLPDRTVRWVAALGRCSHDAEGQPLELIGVDQDITGRKQADLTIRQQKQLLETILEHSPIGFAVNRIDSGAGEYVSRRFGEIYGVASGSIHSVDDFYNLVYVDPVQREQLRARIVADMTTGDAARMRWEDIPITTADGERKVVTATNIPLPEQNLMVSTVQDVTERHVATEGLQRQAEELRRSNAELSRFNRAAVARELRMIALKAEVNTLLKRLDEAPRYHDMRATDDRDETR